jgi:polysaccharide transporter, PST family
LFDIKENIKPYKVLAKNFTSLSILQITNYLFPLITLPYLVRVLGPEKYGLVNFALAFIAYFVTISDYGFNLSVTKQISIFRNDKLKVDEIFSSVLLSKILLGIISVIILMVLTICIQMFRTDADVFLFSFGIVIGNILFPIWFYQGIEKMNYISIVQISIRLVFTISIFVLIVNENDYLLYVKLFSISQILIGVAGLCIALFKFKIRFGFPRMEIVKFQFNEGWSIFLSMVSINIYTTSNTFILGLFAPGTVVGYFAAADKIRIAFQGIISIISQTVYPHVNDLLRNSFNEFSSFIKRLLAIQVVIGIIISLILFLFADFLVEIILGKAFYDSILVIKILSPLPFLISLSNIFGIQTMLSLSFDKQFNIILFVAAVIHILFLFILIPNLFEVGTSISMVITEAFVTSAMFIFVIRKTEVLRNINV